MNKLHCNAVEKKRLKPDVLPLRRLALPVSLSALPQQQVPREQIPPMLRPQDRPAFLLLGTSQHGEKDKPRKQQRAGLASRRRNLLQQLLLLILLRRKLNYQGRLGMSHQLSAPKVLPADELTLNPLPPSETTVPVERRRPDGVQVHDETKAGVMTPLPIDLHLALRNCVVALVETSRPQMDRNQTVPARERSRLLASMSRCT